MKTLINFLLLTSYLLLLSCSDPLTTDDFIQKENPSSGFWEIHLEGDLSGAATIPVTTSGIIHNGIPISFFGVELNTYINGIINEAGYLNAEFYNYFFYEDILFKSTGKFDGEFIGQTSSGTYNFTLLDTYTYSGTWSGFRIE